MDKLQWFKFVPTDWIMGKIQRCDEVTQARFIRLCCLYWNKECTLSHEDAEIEIDKLHLDVLINKKIITLSEGFVNISFLEEQFLEIQEKANGKSKSGIIGNLKRWHLDIYNQFLKKEISLEKAIELSKTIATPSHTDSTPIATPSQSIAEKRRGEEIREDKENINTPLAFSFYNSLIDYGFNKDLVSEWLKVRKTKKLTNTKTAFNNFIKEVEKTKQDKNKVIEECVIKSWGGFKSEWFNKEQVNNVYTPSPTKRRTIS